jgi:hypothetical protein
MPAFACCTDRSSSSLFRLNNFTGHHTSPPSFVVYPDTISFCNTPTLNKPPDRTATIMGRWGDGLFEGDMDLDIISDIDADAEMDLLEPKIRERIEAAHKEHVKAVTSDEEPLQCRCEQALEYIYPSLYTCGEDEDLVREHLEGPSSTSPTESRATALVKKYTSSGGAYELILIGMCFMQLGLTLPTGLKDTMKRIYRSVGLMSGGRVSITFHLHPTLRC